MPNEPKTVIVTGASQGIGAALVKTFLERGYSVVCELAEHQKIRHVRAIG
jgi:NAD(P)-dependent dehydrogenase (short-subunit alcohol dehydrogenase family)